MVAGIAVGDTREDKSDTHQAGDIDQYKDCDVVPVVIEEFF